MAEKKKSKKLQFALFGACSLIALIACMAVLVITTRSVESNNNFVSEYETQSKTELTDNANVLADYLNKLTAQTVGDRFIKADTYTDISVDDSQFTAGTQQAKNLLIYAKNKMLGTVDSYYGEDAKGVFGTADSTLPTIALNADSISDYCFSVGQADDEGNPVYDTSSGELIDSDYYFLTFYVDPQSEGAKELFYLDEDKAVAEKLTAEISSVCSATNASATPTELVIKAKVNRLTDELIYVYFEKSYNIQADVNFTGELEVFGSDSISFVYKAEKKFEYAYAGISFAEKSVTVEPGSEVALSVNAVIEDESVYKVSFASSDESVATVDEMGYVKGIEASCNPVTITVTLEYLGEKFTDECAVIINDDENPNG